MRLIEDRGYEQVAHLYDLFDTKPNFDFFLHYAVQAAEILDIGAGTGRLAIPMAQRGIDVVCVEPSPAMRSQLESKLAQHPELEPRLALVAGDAATFCLRRNYPAAFMSGTFDHFLNDDERHAALDNICRHLVPGGKLIFDVFLGLMKDSPLSPAGEVTVGDHTYKRFVASRLLPDPMLEVTLVFEKYSGTELVERIRQKSRAGVVRRDEVHRLLSRTGYSLTSEYAGYDFAPFEEGRDLLIVEASRRE